MVGERSGDVDAREYVARRGDRLAATDRGVGERLEMRGFGGDRVDARLGDAARGFVEVGRVEAHDTPERLAVGEARFRRPPRVGRFYGHPDMITEPALVADLERGHARQVPILRF